MGIGDVRNPSARHHPDLDRRRAGQAPRHKCPPRPQHAHRAEKHAPTLIPAVQVFKCIHRGARAGLIGDVQPRGCRPRRLGRPIAAVESVHPGNSHHYAGSAHPKAPERAVRRTHRDPPGAHTMRGVRALMPHLWPPATYIDEDGPPLTFQALAARTTAPATRPAPRGAPTHRRQRSHATRWGRVSWHPPDTLR